MASGIGARGRDTPPSSSTSAPQRVSAAVTAPSLQRGSSRLSPRQAAIEPRRRATTLALCAAQLGSGNPPGARWTRPAARRRDALCGWGTRAPEHDIGAYKHGAARANGIRHHQGIIDVWFESQLIINFQDYFLAYPLTLSPPSFSGYYRRAERSDCRMHTG